VSDAITNKSVSYITPHSSYTYYIMDTMPLILIVEDEKPLQDVYKLILQSHGYETLIAGNGLEALEHLKSTVPTLILLDMNMPKMNGLEFMREFVKLKKPCTVVVLSNMSYSDLIDEVMELGAVEKITKAKTGPAELMGIVSKYSEDRQ
jgi:CheY-like chemotaxis protein